MNTPTPTPRTDEVENKIVDLSPSSEGNYFLMKAHARKLERELTAVTEQRDAANAEFYRYYGLWDRATKQLETVTEQRDRLAEALKRIANNNVQDEPHTCYAYEFGRMEGIAKLALAAVKGGSDE